MYMVCRRTLSGERKVEHTISTYSEYSVDQKNAGREAIQLGSTLEGEKARMVVKVAWAGFPVPMKSSDDSNQRRLLLC